MPAICLADTPVIDMTKYHGLIARFRLHLHSKNEISKPNTDVAFKVDIWQIHVFNDFHPNFKFFSWIDVDFKTKQFSCNGRPIEELNTARNAMATIKKIRDAVHEVGNMPGG